MGKAKSEGSNCLCPACGGFQVYIRDTRKNARSDTRRRRFCLDCRHAWTTIEITDDRYQALWKRAQTADKLLAILSAALKAEGQHEPIPSNETNPNA